MRSLSYKEKKRKNTPKVELHSIDSLIVGSYKTGKTRLWKEVTELHYANHEEVLLLAFEPGYETWELENIIPIHEEGSGDDLWKVWHYFKNELVPELVREAKEKRVVKLLGIDTADRCIDAATAWLLKDRASKYGVKKIATLQELTEVSKGNENGYTVLHDEMKKPFDALKNAGYGKMSLAWTKEKETTLYNGMKYNSIELMMHQTGRKIFESQASLICCLFNEVLVYDKSGNELNDNLKDKRGKEKGSNFHETRTVMVFRPTEYISIAGGRYTDLPDEPTEYGSQSFLNVFEKAVKGQLKKTNKTIEVLKTEQEVELKEKVRLLTEKSEKENIVAQPVRPGNENINPAISELIGKITKQVDRFNVSINPVIVPRFKQIFGDTADYKKVTDIAKLTEAYIYISGLESDPPLKK